MWFVEFTALWGGTNLEEEDFLNRTDAATFSVQSFFLHFHKDKCTSNWDETKEFSKVLKTIDSSGWLGLIRKVESFLLPFSILIDSSVCNQGIH